MRPNQNNKNRIRNNRPSNNQSASHVRKGGNPLSRTYESNGPDIKIRGTPHHIVEKYLQLARDAQSSGDQVLAENYLQYSEHYFRIILGAQQGSVAHHSNTNQQIDTLDHEDEGTGMPDRFASPFDAKAQERSVTERTLPERSHYEAKEGEEANAARRLYEQSASEQPSYRNESQDNRPNHRQDYRANTRNEPYANRQSQNRFQAAPQDQPFAQNGQAPASPLPAHVQTGQEFNNRQNRPRPERISQERGNPERNNPERNSTERPNFRQRPRYENRFEQRNQDPRQDSRASSTPSHETQAPNFERGSVPSLPPAHDATNGLPSFIVTPPRPYTPPAQPNTMPSSSASMNAASSQDPDFGTALPMDSANPANHDMAVDAPYRKRPVRTPYRPRKREFEANQNDTQDVSAFASSQHNGEAFVPSPPMPTPLPAEVHHTTPHYSTPLPLAE